MGHPLNADQNCHRNSFVPGLLDAVEFNIRNGNSDIQFFEAGHVVLRIDEKFNGCLAIGWVMPIKPSDNSWQSVEAGDFYAVQASLATSAM
jgi:phenylalanyl-tRNA synthetase beta subunit